jgi:uncharacterized protein (TIGR00297 family)
MRPEERRALTLAACGAGALLFRYVRWWEAIALLSVAVAFAAFGVPRLAGSRVSDSLAELHTPRVVYPLVLLVLVIILPDRLDIVAATWGVLAAGHGIAATGLRARGPRLPWNREKSVAATAAAILCGGAAAAFLCWWCRPAIVPPPYPWFSTWAPIAAALVAGAAATLPIRLQHDITMTAAAAATMWAVSLVSEDLARDALVALGPLLPFAAVVNVAAALGGWMAGAVSRSGAAAGALVGTLIASCAGWGGWTLLIVMYALVVIASRAGSRRKSVLDIAEPNGGRRGAASAVANTGLAAAAAVLAVLTYARTPALVACAAALIAGGADSIASEAGKAWGRRTFLLPGLREVRPGAPGGVSMAGTAAQVVSACALATLAAWLGLIPIHAALPVALGAIAGSMVESALGATLEPAGIVNSHFLNVINTAVAIVVALQFL